MRITCKTLASKYAWLAARSLSLDYDFIRVSGWSSVRKALLIAKKYGILLKHVFIDFKLGASHTQFGGRPIYYDSFFGLAGYQSTIATHQELLGIAGISRAGTVVDVGANVGYFSMLCRELFPHCSVFAFEPVPEIFRCLCANFAGDNRTKLYDLALSDAPGETRMYYHEEYCAESKICMEGETHVKAGTLDSFVGNSDISTIDILKIDTEGHEDSVLRGASKALHITRYLILEITVSEDVAYTISSLLKLLSTETYDFQLVAFKNLLGQGRGGTFILDALFKNVLL